MVYQNTIKTILVLCMLKVVISMSLSEILVLFSDKNCITGSLSSLDKEVESQEIQKLKNDYLPNDVVITGHLDGDKSTLSYINELAQYNDISYSYELLKEEGPPHSKTFTIALYLGDETYKSDGNSLKKAQRLAASVAMKSTKYEHPPTKFKENEKAPTPTVLLNNLASKLGLTVKYSLVKDDILAKLNNQGNAYEPQVKKSYLQKLNETVHLNDTKIHFRKDGGDLKGPFTVKVDVNDAQFYGEAHTIQNAKHEAALKALHGLRDDESVFNCLMEDDNCQLKKRQLIKSPKSLVHEAAQKRNLNVIFEIVDETGPSHKKVFTSKCIVGDLEAIGQGKSKKESKHNAAENILPLLLLTKNNNNLQKNEINQQKLKKKPKKKNDKIIKNVFDKIDHLFDNVKDFVHSFGQNDDDRKPKNDRKSPKKSPTNELLQLGNVLNLQIQFKDFVENNKVYYSIVELGIKAPSVICLGEGVNGKNAKDLASKYGMNTLIKLGFLDNLFDKSMEIRDVLEKEEEIQKVWLEVVETNDKEEL